MGMIKLAMQNFRNGFKNYLSLVISLAFTVLVLFNFQNIIYSHGFEVLGTRNKEYVEMLVQIISFVLGCFMFFFIWYSTNVFLTRRKKEIGIYVFMGLSNDKIGKMYLIESALTGLSALLLGLGLGALSGGLFQMILLAVSDIDSVSPFHRTCYDYSRGVSGHLSVLCRKRLCLHCQKQCAEPDIGGQAERVCKAEERDTGSKIGGRRGGSWSRVLPGHKTGSRRGCHG